MQVQMCKYRYSNRCSKELHRTSNGFKNIKLHRRHLNHYPTAGFKVYILKHSTSSTHGNHISVHQVPSRKIDFGARQNHSLSTYFCTNPDRKHESSRLKLAWGLEYNLTLQGNTDYVRLTQLNHPDQSWIWCGFSGHRTSAFHQNWSSVGVTLPIHKTPYEFLQILNGVGFLLQQSRNFNLLLRLYETWVNFDFAHLWYWKDLESNLWSILWHFSNFSEYFKIIIPPFCMRNYW